MSALPPLDAEQLIQRIRRDLADSWDEEIEMDVEDYHPLPGLPDGGANGAGEKDYRRNYFQQLFRLQAELVKLQDWVAAIGQKVVILFEGRDAAGKGGAIKRITQKLNPRVCRVVALPAPNDRERTQWYFQRYVSHLPAAGEIVLFDRSWYNRAGVEHVMGFCTDEEYEDFFRSVPEFERMLVRSGIRLLKYWFSITDEEQYLRFLGRIHDPLKQWKLSPMDLESRRRWEDYTRAKEIMLERSHIPEARWWVVQAVDKKRARLNCIDHLLKQFPVRRGAETGSGAARARAPRALLTPGRARGDAGARDLLSLRTDLAVGTAQDHATVLLSPFNRGVVRDRLRFAVAGHRELRDRQCHATPGSHATASARRRDKSTLKASAPWLSVWPPSSPLMVGSLRTWSARLSSSDRVRARDLGGVALEVHLHGEIAGAAVDIRPLAARRRGTQIREIRHTVAIGIRRRRWWRWRRRLDARHGRRSHGHRRRRWLAAEARHERKHVQVAVEAIVGVIRRTSIWRPGSRSCCRT